MITVNTEDLVCIFCHIRYGADATHCPECMEYKGMTPMVDYLNYLMEWSR